MNDEATENFDESYNFDSQNSSVDFAFSSYNFGSRSNSSSEFGEEFFETYSPESKSLKDLYDKLESYFYHNTDLIVPDEVYEEITCWKRKFIHLRIESKKLDISLSSEPHFPWRNEEIFQHSQVEVPHNPLLNSKEKMLEKKKNFLENFCQTNQSNQQRSIDEEISDMFCRFLSLTSSKTLFLRSQHKNIQNMDNNSRQNQNPERNIHYRYSNSGIPRVKSSDRREDNMSRFKYKRSPHSSQVKLHRSLETIQEVGNSSKPSSVKKAAIYPFQNNQTRKKDSASAIDKRFNNGLSNKTSTFPVTGRRPLSTASSSVSSCENLPSWR